MDRYVITLHGEAGSTVRAALDDFEVTVTKGTTELRGSLEDRAALYGLLQRLQDLGIEILEVRHEGPRARPTDASHEGEVEPWQP